MRKLLKNYSIYSAPSGETEELDKDDIERRENLLKELKYYLYDRSKEITLKKIVMFKLK